MKTIWIPALVTVIVVSLLLPGSAVNAEFSNKGVVHTVFLWLKQSGNEQHWRQIMLATDRLRAIPGVLDIRYGEAIASCRAIVDDSFDVGTYFYFRDVAAMNRYLVDPVHERVVEQDIRPIVERIVIHDFHDAVLR